MQNILWEKIKLPLQLFNLRRKYPKQFRFLLLRFIPIWIQNTFTRQSITHLPFIKIFYHRPEGNTPTKTRSDNLLHEDDTSPKRYKNSNNKKKFIHRSFRQIDLVRVLRKWVPPWYCIEAHATPVLRLNIIINIIIIRSRLIVYFVVVFVWFFVFWLARGQDT